MFIVESESFTWITLNDVIMQNIVYMILCNNLIMHCCFINLNCMMLLSKICCVDNDELNWDQGWSNQVVNEIGNMIRFFR